MVDWMFTLGMIWMEFELGLALGGYRVMTVADEVMRIWRYKRYHSAY